MIDKNMCRNFLESVTILKKNVDRINTSVNALAELDDNYFEWIASLPVCENEIDIDTQMENLTAMLKNLSEMSGDYSNMLFAILKRLDNINEYVRKRL